MKRILLALSATLLTWTATAQAGPPGKIGYGGTPYGGKNSGGKTYGGMGYGGVNPLPTKPTPTYSTPAPAKSRVPSPYKPLKGNPYEHSKGNPYEKVGGYGSLKGGKAASHWVKMDPSKVVRGGERYLNANQGQFRYQFYHHRWKTRGFYHTKSRNWFFWSPQCRSFMPWSCIGRCPPPADSEPDTGDWSPPPALPDDGSAPVEPPADDVPPVPMDTGVGADDSIGSTDSTGSTGCCAAGKGYKATVRRAPYKPSKP